VYAFLYALFATYPHRSSSTASCESSNSLRRLRWLLFLIDPPESPADRLRPRVDITHRGLDGVVPGDVLQRKGVRVLSRLGQKRVAQSMKSGIRIELHLITGKLLPETPHFRFEYPGLEFLVGVPGLAEDIAAFGLCDQVFENRFRFFVDFEHALAGPPLEAALDDDVAPVAVVVGIFADDHAVFFEIQHLDARDAGVAGENRCRAQRLFGVVDPELIRVYVEDVFDLAFVLVLLNDGSFVDDLQFPPGVAQAFPQRREIPVDRSSSHFPEGPELEALDDGFIDAVERKIAHRLKFEKLLVVALVELDRPRLSGMLGVDPGIELRLKLLECGYPRLFFLDNSDLPLDQLQTVGGRVVERLPLILEAGRLNVCRAAKIEVKIVVGTSGTLEDTHGSARGRMSVVRNKFPDGIGTKHHTAPDFDTRDFLALNPVSERALGDAEDLRRLGNAQQGLDHFK